MSMHIDAAFPDPRTLLVQLIGAGLDGLFVVDGGTRVRLWNPAMERITGLPRRHALGQKLLDLLPQFREIGEDEALVRALGGDCVITRDRPFSTPGGGEGRIECQHSPIRDEQGAVVGALGIVRDVSELHRAVDEVRSLRRREVVLRDRLARAEGRISGMQARAGAVGPTPVVDPRVFDAEAAVGYLSGDEPLLREMAEMFVVAATELMGALDESLAAGDARSAAIQIGRLKETVVGLGGHRATWAAGELEMRLQDAGVEEAGDSWRKLKVEVQRLARALDGWRRGDLRSAA